MSLRQSQNTSVAAPPARPVARCQPESQAESCHKVLKALDNFERSNPGEDFLVLMDKELNEVKDTNETQNQESFRGGERGERHRREENPAKKE